jgi:hypothetical protein
MEYPSPAVSLDQHHWIGLAKALKSPSADPTYTRILERATRLRNARHIRIPGASELSGV